MLLGASVGAGLVWAGQPLLRRLTPPATPPGLRMVERIPAEGEAMGATGTVALRFDGELAKELPRILIDGRPAAVEVEGAWLRIRPGERLRPGAHTLAMEGSLASVGGAILQDPAVMEIAVRAPALVYLRVDGARPTLAHLGPEGQVILADQAAVLGYAGAPDGQHVAYAAANDEGGTDLWLVDRNGGDRRLLLPCGADRCLDLAWSPSGERLAFARVTGDGEGRSGASRIWTLGLEDGEASALYQDPARLGSSPRWSPDGRWLSFYDPATDGLRLLDLDTVREQVVPSRAGLPGSWSPDSASMLVPVLTYPEQRTVVELHLLELDDRSLNGVLTAEAGWGEVGVPAWAPGGDWVAVSARGAGGAGIWRLRPTGDQVTRLAGAPATVFGAPDWDPWGEQLVFQRFTLGDPGAAPDLLVWSQLDSTISTAVEGGSSGSWLP